MNEKYSGFAARDVRARRIRHKSADNRSPLCARMPTWLTANCRIEFAIPPIVRRRNWRSTTGAPERATPLRLGIYRFRSQLVCRTVPRLQPDGHTSIFLSSNPIERRYRLSKCARPYCAPQPRYRRFRFGCRSGGVSHRRGTPPQTMRLLRSCRIFSLSMASYFTNCGKKLVNSVNLKRGSKPL